MPHDLSHSQAQLLGFQINPLSHIPLSIKSSLHSHLHLPSFHICLLFQTAEVNLHTHLQVSCHIICIVSLILDIRLNTFTFKLLVISGIQIFAYGLFMLPQLPPHLFTLILYGSLLLTSIFLVLLYILDYSLKHILKSLHTIY